MLCCCGDDGCRASCCAGSDCETRSAERQTAISLGGKDRTNEKSVIFFFHSGSVNLGVIRVDGRMPRGNNRDARSAKAFHRAVYVSEDPE